MTEVMRCPNLAIKPARATLQHTAADLGLFSCDLPDGDDRAIETESAQTRTQGLQYPLHAIPHKPSDDSTSMGSSLGGKKTAESTYPRLQTETTSHVLLGGLCGVTVVVSHKLYRSISFKSWIAGCFFRGDS